MVTDITGTGLTTISQPASYRGRGGGGHPRGVTINRRCNRTVTSSYQKRKVVFSNTFMKKHVLGGPRLELTEPTTNVSVYATESVLKGTGPAPRGGNDQSITYHGMHHVGLLCANLEKSLEFYIDVLGLEMNPDRPHDKLPYRGAWLWIGPEMIHLMELPNPDPLHGRPEHGGRDRHFCVGVKDIVPLQERLDVAGIEYTKSMSGRQALFFRDPDMNCLEIVEMASSWR